MSGCKLLMVFLTAAQSWCKSKQKYWMPRDWQNILFMLLAYLAKGVAGIDVFIPFKHPTFPLKYHDCRSGSHLTCSESWELCKHPLKLANTHWVKGWWREHLNLWMGHHRPSLVPPLSSCIILPSLCSPRTSTTPVVTFMWHSASHLSEATRAWEICAAGLGGIGPQCCPSACFFIVASFGGSLHTSCTSCCSSPSHQSWSLRQPLRLPAANPCDFQSFPNFGHAFA